jgi:hypothetical protein
MHRYTIYVSGAMKRKLVLSPQLTPLNLVFYERELKLSHRVISSLNEY